MRAMATTLQAVCLAALLAAALPAGADIEPELPGQVETLAKPFGAHWVWVTDLVLERAALLDLDAGRFLGIVNGGYGTIAPLFSHRRDEMYVPSTYYSRRTRGRRTDVLELHDIATLAPAGEVVLPGKRATDAVAQAHQALSDDERFAAVFNWTPRTSLSIVDVEKREFSGEIDIPGCALVYAAGPRRFFALCADGAAMVVTLDDAGRESGRARTEPFFDPRTDPVTEKAVRLGDTWLFVSFDGWVYPVDVSGAELRFGEKWSLFSAAERVDSWRIGGNQHLAVHARTGRLFSLVHRGPVDGHKEPGEEVWVYDVGGRERVLRIPLRSPGITVYGFPIDPGPSWRWLSEWIIDSFLPAAVSHIEVTRDDEPLLVTATQFSGSLGIYDARSGDFLRRVQPTGWTTDLLIAPWGGE